MTEPRKPDIKDDSHQPASDMPQAEVRRPGRPREIQYSLEKKFTLLLPKDVHKALKVKSAELEHLKQADAWKALADIREKLIFIH